MTGIRFIVTRQSLLTTRYLGLSRTESIAHFRFLEDVLDLVNFCFSQDNYSSHLMHSYWALAHHCDDLIPLLELVGEGESQYGLLTELSKFNLIDYTRVGSTDKTTACHRLLTPDCFPPLIRMIGQTNNKVDHTGQLLQAMVRRMRAINSTPRRADVPWNDVPSIDYLHPFTRTPQGFSALTSAIKSDDQAERVTRAVIDIVHLAAGQDPSLTVDHVELYPSAVPEFLEAISIAATHVEVLVGYEALLVQFSSDALDLLKVASKDEQSKQLLGRHLTCKRIWDALRGVENEKTKELMKRFKASEDELGIKFEEVEPDKIAQNDENEDFEHETVSHDDGEGSDPTGENGKVNENQAKDVKS
ncbi:hypothetical protein FRC07_004705 [Ceratobasidium sp. 392]|nr:hypothetical protein FRC07_004705 [Ceratobasidium sp. 392]